MVLPEASAKRPHEKGPAAATAFRPGWSLPPSHAAKSVSDRCFEVPKITRTGLITSN